MSWAKLINDWAEKVGKESNEVAAAVIFRLNDLIITATRVDTGRARGGWVAGVDSQPTGEGSPDKTGKRTINKANSKVIKSIGKFYYLVNNVHYVVHLEYGTDRTPPDAMVRNAIKKVKSELRSRSI
jgi:hypothetical protein